MEATLSNPIRVKAIRPNPFEKVKRLIDETNEKIKKTKEKYQTIKDDKDFEKIRDEILAETFKDFESGYINVVELNEDFKHQLDSHQFTSGTAADAANLAMGARESMLDARGNRIANAASIASAATSITTAAANAFTDNPLASEVLAGATTVAGSLPVFTSTANLIKAIYTACGKEPNKLVCWGAGLVNAAAVTTVTLAIPILNTLQPLFQTTISATLAGVTHLINKRHRQRTSAALTADMVDKYKSSIEECEKLVSKVEEFTQEIGNDKQFLLNLKKTARNKNEFKQGIRDYLKQKVAPIVSGLGLAVNIELSEEMKQLVAEYEAEHQAEQLNNNQEDVVDEVTNDGKEENNTEEQQLDNAPLEEQQDSASLEKQQQANKTLEEQQKEEEQKIAAQLKGQQIEM